MGNGYYEDHLVLTGTVIYRETFQHEKEKYLLKMEIDLDEKCATVYMQREGGVERYIEKTRFCPAFYHDVWLASPYRLGMDGERPWLQRYLELEKSPPD